jgi:hypothetical protein
MGGVTHNFESGPPKDHFNSNFSAKDFDVIYQNELKFYLQLTMSSLTYILGFSVRFFQPVYSI